MNHDRFELGEPSYPPPVPAPSAHRVTANQDAAALDKLARVPTHLRRPVTPRDQTASPENKAPGKVSPSAGPESFAFPGVNELPLHVPLSNWQLSGEGLDNEALSAKPAVPGWLVSFTVHLAILIALGCWSLAGPLQERLSLVAGTSGALAVDNEVAVDFRLMSAESNPQALEGSGEELQFAKQTDSLITDDPTSVEGIRDGLADSGMGLGNEFAGVGSDEAAELLASLSTNKEAGGGEDGNANFFGLSARGSRFVFVIDCSGSMMGQRWQATVQELFRSLRGMRPETQFLVLLYNTDTWAMFNTPARDVQLISASPENVDKLQRWMSLQRPGGSTLPMGAMSAALSLNPDAIFLLSDGEFQDDTVGFLANQNIARPRRDGSEGKIPVHTIAMDFSPGLLFLRQIAYDNEGQFRVVNSQ